MPNCETGNALVSVDLLIYQVRVLRLPQPELEYRFHQGRRWRADLAWPDKMLIVEFEGGVYTKGRHTRGRGFENDCEKYNTATLEGWRVLRFTSKHVRTGLAALMIARALIG